jgi:hypothetical protein
MPRKTGGERTTDGPAATRKTTTRRAPRTTRTARKTPPTTVASPAPGFTDEQVRERAYYIFLERNGGPGDPIADWHQAERELRDATSAARA